SDLARSPRTPLVVQCVGDAHLANFGGFASPERDLVFDINDFDETNAGPFEWDVKRLAASFEIAARAHGLPEALARSIVLSTVRAYRRAVRRFATMSDLGVWYARLDAAALLARAQRRLSPRDVARIERRAEKATGKDSVRAFVKLAIRVN